MERFSPLPSPWVGGGKARFSHFPAQTKCERRRVGRGRFLIVSKAENGAGHDVYVTQDDINNVITAKAAIFAATRILLDRLELDYSDLTTLFIAGGFGSYIDRRNAIKIGLLPEMPISRMKYVGNTSIWGAKIAGFCEEPSQ